MTRAVFDLVGSFLAFSLVLTPKVEGLNFFKLY